MKKTVKSMIIGGCLVLAWGACASKPIVPEAEVNGASIARTIALMPVENQTTDQRAPQMMRQKVFDELRFRGYPSLAPEVVDRALQNASGRASEADGATVRPQALRDLTGADAVMYCAITESDVSLKWFYAPVTLAARCELRCAQTGEALWSAEHKATSRSFDITPARVKFKSYGAFEDTLEEVVGKVMETMPDGPGLRG